MSDKDLKNFPNAVIQTVEFDSFIRETGIFANRLKSVGRLKEYTVLPGAVHGLGGNTDDDWV